MCVQRLWMNKIFMCTYKKQVQESTLTWYERMSQKKPAFKRVSVYRCIIVALYFVVFIFNAYLKRQCDRLKLQSQ